MRLLRLRLVIFLQEIPTIGPKVQFGKDAGVLFVSVNILSDILFITLVDLRSH